MDDTLQLLTTAAAALLVGLAAGWAVRSAAVRRKLSREQAFFGLPDGSECVLVTHRDSSSAHWSIPRHDALALLGLAAVVENCGAHPEIAPHDTGLQGFGARTEFCVGDPTAHRRLAAHLANLLPGVAVHPGDESGAGRGTFTIGGSAYRMEPGAVEYVLLARLRAGEGTVRCSWRPASARSPTGPRSATWSATGPDWPASTAPRASSVCC